MSEYRVLIMAGGTQRDWSPQGYRQLLTVDNVTLIDRLVRQSQEIFNADPIIIKQDFTKPFGSGYRYFVPESHNTPVESLGCTERLWGDVTVVLQGDTYYPDVAINLIYLKDFFAYGRGAELYALKFEQDKQSAVRGAIKTAKASRLGKLWSVYRAYEGFHVEAHKIGPTFYTFKDADSPIDFDKMEQYNNFIITRKAVL